MGNDSPNLVEETTSARGYSSGFLLLPPCQALLLNKSCASISFILKIARYLCNLHQTSARSSASPTPCSDYDSIGAQRRRRVRAQHCCWFRHRPRRHGGLQQAPGAPGEPAESGHRSQYLGRRDALHLAGRDLWRVGAFAVGRLPHWRRLRGDRHGPRLALRDGLLCGRHCSHLRHRHRGAQDLSRARADRDRQLGRRPRVVRPVRREEKQGTHASSGRGGAVCRRCRVLHQDGLAGQARVAAYGSAQCASHRNPQPSGGHRHVRRGHPELLCGVLGIGLHNIPEGIAVAAPIYFATGSRWRGIMWCAISACAEPVGGVIAWLAVGDGMDPISEGILFGIVCGIMVCICVKELIPTAYKFAKGKTAVVALGMFAGMFIMVASLTLFGYAGV